MVSECLNLNAFLVFNVLVVSIMSVDPEKARKYCGTELDLNMSKYCLFYPSPSHPFDRRKREIEKGIVDECCKKPCTLNQMLTMYCQEIDKEQLEKDRLSVTSSPVQNDEPHINENEIFPKTQRKRTTRRRRNCSCKKPHKRIDRKLMEYLRNRIVPPHNLGHITEAESIPFYITYRS